MNDKGICTLVEKAATGWLAQQEMQNSATQQELLHANEEGATAKAEALRYADWLITTCNDCVPQDTCMEPTSTSPVCSKNGHCCKPGLRLP